jgi:hypothetical protein
MMALILYLLKDTGTVWLGPLAPGSSSSPENSQCVVGGAGSSATASENDLTLRLAVTFKSAFGGTKTIYMQTTGAARSTPAIEHSAGRFYFSRRYIPPWSSNGSPRREQNTTSGFRPALQRWPVPCWAAAPSPGLTPIALSPLYNRDIRSARSSGPH